MIKKTKQNICSYHFSSYQYFLIHGFTQVNQTVIENFKIVF